MKFITTIIFIMTTLSISAQSLSPEDMLNGIHHCKDLPAMKKYLELHDILYDTILLPNATAKTYSFKSSHERMGSSGNVKIPDVILLRVDDEHKLGKMTIITASLEYYEQIVTGISQRKFKAAAATSGTKQDTSVPKAYTSELYPGISIALSVTQAVKDGVSYSRYTIGVTY